MKYLPALIGDSFRRLVLTVLVTSLVASALHAAPSFAPGGGAIPVFTHNGPGVVVDPLVAVTGADPFDSAKVCIANFLSGDILSYDNAALPAGVNGSWNSTTGVLSFSGSASPADWQALFRTVKIATTSGDITTRTVTINAGTAQYFAGTGHFYEFVPDSGISWDVARDAAAARKLFGLQGYLVTVTSAEENTFVGTNLSGQGWMGASDVAQESIWRWVTGPEGLLDSGQGLHFFTQNAANANSPSLNSVYSGNVGGGGTAIGGAFIGWRTFGNAEPNDYNPGEDYGIFLGVDNWNDYNIAGGDVPSVGYVIEYGGMPGDPVVSLAASSSVTVIMPAPIVTAVSPSVGRTDGGATITITGTNFTGASAVKFGATSAISYSVVSDTSIIGVIAPAGSVGTVDITVTNEGGTSGIVANDQFTYFTPLATCTVTSNSNSGAGSLRDAISLIASDGTITLGSSLSGQTIVLTSTLSIPRSLRIDGSAAEPHLKISGGGVFLVFNINSGVTVTLAHLDIIDGNDIIVGGINNGGTLSVQNCTVRNNSGDFRAGGIYNRGNLTIENSTISGNQGGGIWNDTSRTLTMLNCTVSGNSGSSVGGICSRGVATIDHCTIVNNTGSQRGIYSQGTALTISNSIVANNGTGGTNNFSIASGTFTSLGYNLSNDWNGQTKTTGDLETPVVLDALADNNGDTQTHALQAGSPALDAADPADATATDQRGIARPQGAASDIGAFETRVPTVTAISPASGPAAGGTSVTITGSGFTGATGVNFGSTSATDVIVVDDTSITATSPAGAAGVVDITVTTVGPSATDTNDQFTYIDPTPTYTVTSTADIGTGTLREAISVIASGGTITLGAGLSGQTIVLESPLTLAQNMTIDGTALGTHVQISGNHQWTVFTVSPSGTTVTLAGLDIIDGSTPGFGGGILNAGTLTLLQCTVSGNTAVFGGGIVNGAGAVLTLRDSTVSGNSASILGGIFNHDGKLTMENSTLAGNQAKVGAGGAFGQEGADATATVSHCTIVDNIAASPYEAVSGLAVSGGALTLNNSIVANNGADGTGNFVVEGTGSITSLGYNLSNAWNGQATTTGDLTDDPLLDALADNGGATQTCALLIGSPAINAADPNDPIGTDQRGVSRPQVGRSDIGAFEFIPGVASVDVPSDGTYAAGQNLDFMVHFSNAVTVGGTPRLALTIGGSTRYADYFSGSGTTGLVFRYTLQPGDTDNDGIVVGSAIELNGGTLSGLLTLNGAGATTGVFVDTTAPAAPAITSVTATTISGTAEVGSTVKIFDGSTLLGTTTTASDGTWSLPVTLVDGTHSLTATATDGAGNVGSASTVITPTIDAVPPAAPLFSTPTITTNDTTPTLSGTAEASSTIRVYDGAILLGITTAGSDGKWSFTPTLALSEGVHAITAKATDLAGNTGAASSEVSLTIDVTAPVSPAITSVTATTISGTAEVGSTVKIFDGSTLLGTTTASINGTWSLPVTLADGAHNLTAAATDGAGNVGTGSTVITPMIDTVAPAAPVISTTAISTNDTTPTLPGTAEAGSTVKIYDGATMLGTTTVGSDGMWSFAPTTPLSEGAHIITTTSTDTAGNTSAVSPALTVMIDTTAPVVPGITNITATTVSGTGEPGGTVQVMDGSTLLGTTTIASDGTWSLPVTLVDGTHSITATVTDGAGNSTNTPAGTTTTIDTVAPAAPVISTTAISTNDTTPTFSGTAEAGSAVKIYDGATMLGTTTAGSDGTWSFTPPTPLSEGAHSITAKTTDVAGNTSPASSAVSLMIDITVPVAPAISTVSATVVGGTAEAGSTVKIFDGLTLLGTTTASINGTWSLPVTLADGAHSLTATATDGSGNVGTGSTVITPTIDTIAPAAPVISNASGNTTVKTPTLMGTAETGSTVKIYDGTTLLGTTTATGGTWGFTLTTPLTDGTHAITAKATDTAGNTSAAAALALVVGTAPAITTSPVAKTVADGSVTSFTVSATGTATLDYQWQQSADNTAFVAVFGATAATYTISSTTVAHTGYYRVIVTNSFGTATSASALLAVTPVYTAPKPDGSAAAVTGGSGTGSQSVTVLTAADFKTYATSSTPYVITVVGTLNIGTVNVASNKTIQGADENASLLGNLNLGPGVSNVVIRGVNLTNPGSTIVNGAYTDGGDALTLSGASNVFVTHVTFFDCADHAIKIINGSDNVTVSWCEFYNTSSTLLHRTSVQIGTGSESKPLHVTLHHNWWTTNVDQQMPLSTYGYVHEYNNYFASASDTSGTVVSDQSQLLSERNVYAGLANPLTKQTVSATLTAGKVRVIGNLYTSCTGTTPDAGTDVVFTPAYSYEMLPTSDVATEVATLAGNTAGAGSSDAATGTATSAGPTAAVTPGASFTLTSASTGFTATTHQWRLNNGDVAGATASTYTCSNAQTASAGTYTVAISMASGDTVVSTPLVVALGSVPPTNSGNSGGSGGGSFEAWFCAALALLGSLHVMHRRIR
jgi:pectate lyase